MSTDAPQSKEAAVKLADSDFSNDRRKHDMNSALLDYWHKIKAGELGALPAILGLIALVALFTALKPDTFLSKGNIANLATQALPITILAMGLVFVLLLGEIDLSAGVASGVCAAVMAKLMVDSGQSWYVAVLSAVAIGVVIGTVIGWLVAFLRIPSFVVTLAFFLGLQGITLWLIGDGGTVPVRDDFVVALANKNMPIWLGWVLAIACVVGYSATLLLRWRRQNVRNLHSKPLGLVVAQCAVVAAALLISTYVLSLDRAPSPLITLGGIPWGVLLVGGLLVICTFVLGRTGYGRHIYAVGGNSEAARRAHQRHPHQDLGVHDRLRAGGGQRHRRRVPPQLRRDQLGRRQHAAVRGGRRGHRRDEPVRRARQGTRRRARRPRHRAHRERAGAARHQGLPQLPHHRGRAAVRREHRRPGEAPPVQRGQMTRWTR
ncbi:sugar ABC transporter permease [Actinomadura luteofluorescens]